MNEKEPLSSSRIKAKKRYFAKKAREKFVIPDPRCANCFHWREVSGLDEQTFCCHYTLDTGKLRKKISKTKCGSFADRDSTERKKSGLRNVPMSQWGSGSGCFK